MPYRLSEINGKIKSSPESYILECEERFNGSVSAAAELIAENLKKSPIVLLSGPSGSGKTTTAKKLTVALARLGVRAHTISLDNYFVTINPESAPRTPEGDIDYESPRCLDMDLLNRHFRQLAAGEEIIIPHFNFAMQRREPERAVPLRLAKDEIAVFEGIHALNECITFEHPLAFKLYVSTMSEIECDAGVIVRESDFRLLRRIVRDNFFRGTDPGTTVRMWRNIRRGEILNIAPYRSSAHLVLDSTLPYEVSVIKPFVLSAFGCEPAAIADHFEELGRVVRSFGQFADADAAYVPGDSILREFIGGSSFEY